MRTVKGQYVVHTIFEIECFLTCSWRFLRYNTLEQLEFKLEKIFGIQKPTGKVRKQMIYFTAIFFKNCTLFIYKYRQYFEKRPCVHDRIVFQVSILRNSACHWCTITHVCRLKNTRWKVELASVRKVFQSLPAGRVDKIPEDSSLLNKFKLKKLKKIIWLNI